MSDITVENDEPPIGQATIVYLGPAAPHWEIRPVFGERDVMDSFRDRVNARLLLLPPHDPQFRRNRERVNATESARDIVVEWDLGYPRTSPTPDLERGAVAHNRHRSRGNQDARGPRGGRRGRGEGEAANASRRFARRRPGHHGKVAASVDPDATATAIGIGAPGPVVPGTGVLPAAPNLPGWDHDVPVADLMSERLGGRPVVVGNDVNVGTLAEHRLGAGKGVDDLLGVFAGTGVGAGLILDGQLARVLVGSPVRSATSSSHSVTSPSKLKDSVAVNSRITQAARRSSAVSSPPVPRQRRRCLRCDPMAASSRKPGPWRSR